MSAHISASFLPSSRTRAGLFGALGALDGVLEGALTLARSVYGWEPESSQFRGLFITRDDVERMLERPVAASPIADGAGAARLHSLTEIPGIADLSERYGLDWFDCAVLLIALAPELDLRYERVYAYLQDDVTLRRPTVDLALNLLTTDAESKLQRRSHFASDAPLLRSRIIELPAPVNQSDPPLLSRTVRLDPQIVRMLLESDELDARLAPYAKQVTSDRSLVSLPLPPGHAEALRRLAFGARAESTPMRIAFGGAPGGLKRRTAEALAGELGRPLLVLDGARLASSASNLEQIVAVAFREAELSNAILLIVLDEAGDEVRLHRLVADAAAGSLADVVISWRAAPRLPEPLNLFEVEFPLPPFETRRLQWQVSASARNLRVSEEEIESLAERFRLNPDEIESAMAIAGARALWRGERNVSVSDMAAAARAQSGLQIGQLARRIEPVATWNDIVLPAGTIEQLRAICGRVGRRHRVLDDWGFDRKLSNGKGVTALFAGPSGVGKTMAAEVIARELELDLYKIDLSGVVSKYIGETEKNLERIFAAAENASAILFFDEADALFGKRSEVRDSHDRYANIEISYLLQKMETYDGVAILASNLRQNLDESFVRRLAFTIHFPFPDEPHRRRIWAGIWPEQAPLDPEVDLDFLASGFKLSGGNIRNVALAAAFLAAEAGSAIRMSHLMVAVEREYQKMSKPVGREQFGRWAPETQA